MSTVDLIRHVKLSTARLPLAKSIGAALDSERTDNTTCGFLNASHE